MDQNNVVEGLFNSWRKSMDREMNRTQYTAKGRQEPLEDLAQSLFDANVDYDTACDINSRLKFCLVNEKGRKAHLHGYDKKKHERDLSNWQKNVESEFLAIVFDIYNANGSVRANGGVPNLNAPTEATVSVGMFEWHGLIELWGSKVFGNVWCRELNDLAHTKDSSLHNRFLDELFC